MIVTKSVCVAALVAFLATSLAATAADTSTASATLSPALTAKVDALFSKWDSPNTPGAALGVIRDGQLIYARGYGTAILEAGTPITPTTIFDLASVSKQFTAFAVLLLEQAGKLSIDDDVHKYIPELPDYGAKITIRHLLNHTSGIRDQLNLLALAGWREEDVTTDDEVLPVVMRQKKLNFAPGEQWNYSNSNYTLLALIVKRVSGKPLAEFAAENIFAPLGMAHTHFQADFRTVVKNRAYSYMPDDKGAYKYVPLSFSNVGPSSLLSTIEDLARWDQNFYDARVGGPAVIARMQEAGKLNNGTPTSYAAGLGVGDYRGLKIVEHNGSVAGFRSDILRFPGAHFSVILLCNTEIDTGELPRRIADLVLADALAPAAPPPAPKRAGAKAIKVSEAAFDPYLGDYAFDFGLRVDIAKRDGKLFEDVGPRPFLLTPVAGGAFTNDNAESPFSITFAKDKAGAVERLIVHNAHGDFPANRLGAHPLTAAEAKVYEGDYYSEELGVVYRVAAENGALTVHYPRGPILMQRAGGGDTFYGDFPLDHLAFTRGAQGEADGFTVGNGRVEGLRFSRVHLAP